MDIGCVYDSALDATFDLWMRRGLAEAAPDAMAALQRARAAANAIVLVGRIEGENCATAMVGFDGHRAWAYYVAVDPRLQGSGLGRAMMKAAEAWARERGAPKLMLMVSLDNEKVLGFYNTLGFQVRPFKPLAIPL